MKDKLKYKRAICDSDFDGCICATIIKEAINDIEIIFCDAFQIKSEKIIKLIDENTIIADLPFNEKCGLYLDHHHSNKPNKRFNGVWKAVDCAAIIVFEYFLEFINKEKYEGILFNLAKFDSGKMEEEDVKNPNNFMKLGFAMDRKDKAFQYFVVNYLYNHTFDELMKEDVVVTKFNVVDKNIKEFTSYVKEHHKVEGGLVFVDLREYKGEFDHSYFVGAKFNDVYGIILIKKYKNGMRLGFYNNVFSKKRSSNIDFLKIAESLNPVSYGGHKNACGAEIQEGENVETLIDKIVHNANIK